jgi:hypothetical protein
MSVPQANLCPRRFMSACTPVPRVRCIYKPSSSLPRLPPWCADTILCFESPLHTIRAVSPLWRRRLSNPQPCKDKITLPQKSVLRRPGKGNCTWPCLHQSCCKTVPDSRRRRFEQSAAIDAGTFPHFLTVLNASTHSLLSHFIELPFCALSSHPRKLPTSKRPPCGFFRAGPTSVAPSTRHRRGGGG